MDKERCKVITMSTAKGGVGKSASVASLSYLTGAKGFPTLTIDMDPSSNVTTLLSGQKNHKFSIYELFKNIDQLDAEDYLNFIQKTDFNNLYLLPGSIFMEQMAETLIANEAVSKMYQQLVTSGLINNERIKAHPIEQYDYFYSNTFDANLVLKRIIDILRKEFDYIFIDTPPTYNVIVRNTLCAADYVISPIAADGYSYEGLQDTIDHINEIKTTYNENLYFHGFFFANVDYRHWAYKKLQSEYSKQYNNYLMTTGIRREQANNEATMIHEPLPFYAPDGKATLDYKKLLIELELLPEKEEKRLVKEIRQHEKKLKGVN